MHFWVVGLSTTSVPTLYSKDQLMGDDTIYPELLPMIKMVHFWRDFVSYPLVFGMDIGCLSHLSLKRSILKWIP